MVFFFQAEDGIRDGNSSFFDTTATKNANPKLADGRIVNEQSFASLHDTDLLPSVRSHAALGPSKGTRPRVGFHRCKLRTRNRTGK